MQDYSFHRLADHIQCCDDTQTFLEAFDDKSFGWCEEMFEEGPAYWHKVPELRATWKKADLAANKTTQAIFDMLARLGHSMDRSLEQINQLKKAVAVGLLTGRIPPQITSSPYSTGKTVLAMNLACVLAALKPEANIWLVALNDADAIQQRKFLQSKGISADIATEDADFE